MLNRVPNVLEDLPDLTNGMSLKQLAELSVVVTDALNTARRYANNTLTLVYDWSCNPLIGVVLKNGIHSPMAFEILIGHIGFKRAVGLFAKHGCCIGVRLLEECNEE